MYHISFITTDAPIRSQLEALGHTESQTTREDLIGFIPDNFCRDETDLAKSLKVLVMNEQTTVIFVDGGSKILGMTVLNKYNSHLMLEAICVPESEKKKGIGSILLACVKELAKRMNLPVVLLSLSESLEPFYEKQGFVKDADDEDFYIFKIPSDGDKKSRKSRKLRKLRKTRKSRKLRKTRKTMFPKIKAKSFISFGFD